MSSALTKKKQDHVIGRSISLRFSAQVLTPAPLMRSLYWEGDGALVRTGNGDDEGVRGLGTEEARSATSVILGDRFIVFGRTCK